jgi:hypothetical protein
MASRVKSSAGGKLHTPAKRMQSAYIVLDESKGCAEPLFLTPGSAHPSIIEVLRPP